LRVLKNNHVHANVLPPSQMRRELDEEERQMERDW
jgi:hypothetical protein